MKTLRLLLHSFILTLVNIFTILIASGIYHLIGSGPQIVIQAPIAALLTVVAFLIWSQIIRRLFPEKLTLQEKSELLGTFFLALLWTPTLFVHLHYIGRGYVTSLANIWALWLFQLPVNLVALFLIWQINKGKSSGEQENRQS
jgi:hypothetical protein